MKQLNVVKEKRNKKEDQSFFINNKAVSTNLAKCIYF